MGNTLQMLDNITANLDKQLKTTFTDISFSRNRHLAMSKILKKNPIVIDGGNAYKYRVKVDNPPVAGFSDERSPVPVSTVDMFTDAEIDTVTFVGGYEFTEDERLRNSGSKTQLIRLIKARRDGALQSAADIIERATFSLKPASDTKTMNGLFNYLVDNATEGFNGIHPTGYSDVLGISATEYSGWRNYTGHYSAYTYADMIKKIKLAHNKTKFYAPIPGTDAKEPGDDFEILTTYNVFSSIETLLENDQFSNFVRSASLFRNNEGKLFVNNIPITIVPELENVSGLTDPILGINWSTFNVVTRGEKIDFVPPTRRENNPNQWVGFFTMRFNLLCTNRRANFILSQGS